MQKYIDHDVQNQQLLIKSAIALDHLKGYLYIESEKEAYVRQVKFFVLGCQLDYIWYFKVSVQMCYITKHVKRVKRLLQFVDSVSGQISMLRATYLMYWILSW